MILIKHNNIDTIANYHKVACKKYILPRLNFYIDLFNALGNKVYLDKSIIVKDYYKLEFITLCTLINPLVINKYKKSDRKCKLTNKIHSILTAKQNNVIKNKRNLEYFKNLHIFFTRIKNNIDFILTAKPKELFEHINQLKYKGQNYKNIKECIEKVFNYEDFTKVGFSIDSKNKWDSYKLTSYLDLSVCPYCNKNWIQTVTNGKTKLKVTNPQLDHFFNKSDYPLLRLSFYNLIPSCETCNARLKKNIDFSFDKFLHPYIDEFEGNSRFKVFPKSYMASVGLSNDYKVKLDIYTKNLVLKEKINNNNTVFEIEKIYEKSGDVISELFQKRRLSDYRYLVRLQESFPKWNPNIEELYKVAFCNYYNKKDFNKRPFAKLTKDIALQLNLIDK